MYQCKADIMEHADNEDFFLAPLTNIPNFSLYAILNVVYKYTRCN